MGERIRRRLTLVVVFIGTIIGTGFTSGQELLHFFSIHGKQGYYGLVLAGFIYFVLCWCVLSIVHKNRLGDLLLFFKQIAGDINGGILTYVGEGAMFYVYCSMLYNVGILLAYYLKIPSFIGTLLMALTCYIIFTLDIKGLVIVNTIFAPILMIGSFILGILILFMDHQVFNSLTTNAYITDNWIISAIGYVGFNGITAICVLVNLHMYIRNKKDIWISAILSWGIFVFLGLLMGTVIFHHIIAILDVEIPLLKIIMRHPKWLQAIYYAILFLGILTTAVSNGYGIISRKKDKIVARRSLTLIGIVVALIQPFEQLAFVADFFVLFGLYEIILIITYYIKEKIQINDKGKGATWRIKKLQLRKEKSLL